MVYVGGVLYIKKETFVVVKNSTDTVQIANIEEKNT